MMWIDRQCDFINRFNKSCKKIAIKHVHRKNDVASLYYCKKHYKKQIKRRVIDDDFYY